MKVNGRHADVVNNKNRWLSLCAGGLAAVLLAPSALAEEAPLERCSEPKGTLAVAEPQDHVLLALTRYNLPAPTSLLRTFVQESNCFTVVERGRAMQNLKQERDLASSGMLQGGSNVGGGQMLAADFVITPDVLFKDNNAGGAGIGAAVGSLFGSVGSVVGAVAGGVKFQEAETTLLLADVRSGAQVASAKGSAKKTDWAFGGILGAVGGGAYTSTDEGKVVAAALLDNYNTIVRTIKDKPSLLVSTSAAAQRNAANATAAVNFAEGAVLTPKIKTVKVMSDPSSGASVAFTISKGDELVYLGESTDGYLYVAGDAGEGWVKAVLVR